MAKLENFTASMEMASGLKPSGENDFPLVQAHDIVVDEEDKRLDTELNNIKLKAATDGNTIINHTQDIASVKSRLTTLENKEDEVGNLEIIALSGSSGTLDATKFAELKANPQGYALQKAVDGVNYVMTYCGDGSVSYLYAMSYMTSDGKLNSILCTVSKDGGAYSVVQQLGVDLTGSLELDATLSVSGKAADAKAVGDAIANLSGGSGVVIISLGSDTSYTLSSEQLASLNANPESFAFSISDSKLSGRTVVLRYHASSTQTRTFVSVYAYENTIYAYQCLVTIGGGVCTVAQNSYPIESGTSGGSYVLELTAPELTDEQCTALEANVPNVVAFIDNMVLPLSLYEGGVYYFIRYFAENANENGNKTTSQFLKVDVNEKTVEFDGEVTEMASKTYVDNAVANAGGGVADGFIPIIFDTEGDTKPEKLPITIEQFLEPYRIVLVLDGFYPLAYKENGQDATGAYIVFGGKVDGVYTECKVREDGSYIITEGNSSGGGGIIDVTELPTENIDEKSIYRVTTEGSAEVWIVHSEMGGVVNYGEMVVAQMEAEGVVAHLNIELVDAIDANTMKEMTTTNDDGSMSINMYIVNDPNSEQYGWVYVLDNAEVGPQAMGEEIGVNGGWVEEATADLPNGVYAVMGDDVITYHIYKDKWVELAQKDYVDDVKNTLKSYTDTVGDSVYGSAINAINEFSNTVNDLKIRQFNTYTEAINFIANDSAITPWKLHVQGEIVFAGGSQHYTWVQGMFDVDVTDKIAGMSVIMLHYIKADYQVTLAVTCNGTDNTTTVKSYAKEYVKETNEQTVTLSGTATLYYF